MEHLLIDILPPVVSNRVAHLFMFRLLLSTISCSEEKGGKIKDVLLSSIKAIIELLYVKLDEGHSIRNVVSGVLYVVTIGASNDSHIDPATLFPWPMPDHVE